ncbi:MAG TPA: glycosyltransferase family 2 protein, partial [Abditibacteriaceae bacterium]
EIDKEIIIVDNCSTDGTRDDLRALIERGEAELVTGEEPSTARVRIVFQEINRGKGSSVRRALELARGDWIIVQDADLEYDPNDYHRMLACGEKGRNRSAVFGSRLMRGSTTRGGQPRTAFYYGRVGLSLVFRLLYASPLSDVATCYKLIRRSVAQSLNLRGSGFDLDFEIAAKLRRRGIVIHEVPISYAPRTELEGKKIRVVEDGLRAVWVLWKYRFVD